MSDNYIKKSLYLVNRLDFLPFLFAFEHRCPGISKAGNGRDRFGIAFNLPWR